MVLAAGFAGCSPIETLRSVRGLDKNDPDPATAPFGENIAKSEAGSYPNLASVPPPPVLTSTTAERKTLAEGLTAAGASAQKPDASGTRGSAASGPVPPPPPIPPSLAAAEAPAAPLPPLAEAKPTPVPMRKMDEPPPPAALASTEQTPQFPGPLPGVERPRPAAPQGAMSAIPQPEPSNLPPAAVQSGNPQPTPPPAVLPPAQPSPEIAARPAPKAPPVATTIAALDLPAGATALAPDDGSRVATVIAQYQRQPRPVRVVAYAAPATGSAEQLNSFRAALDRAQIVANKLTEGGVPANKIQTEAAPSGASKPPGHVEVQFLP